MKLPALVFGLVLPLNLLAADIDLESGPKQKVVIELYTSQGCNSCPSAEAYLNTFSKHAQLWTHYIPMALHVDYWDSLGWKDRFANPAHSQRQRRYAQTKNTRTVFTPAFFVNGELWRPGFLQKLPAPTLSEVGNLKVSLRDKVVQAHFQPIAGPTDALSAHVALVGLGLQTRIQAGENKGRHSSHEFVVLGQNRLTRKNQNEWQGTLPVVKPVNASRYALVVWMAHSASPRPIQAVGGFLPRAPTSHSVDANAAKRN